MAAVADLPPASPPVRPVHPVALRVSALQRIGVTAAARSGSTALPPLDPLPAGNVTELLQRSGVGAGAIHADLPRGTRGYGTCTVLLALADPADATLSFARGHRTLGAGGSAQAAGVPTTTALDYSPAAVPDTIRIGVPAGVRWTAEAFWTD